MSTQYWLFKSEPSVFSIDDLSKCKNAETYWDGVRNYQARNFLRDTIKKGDLVFFYHSNADPLTIAGLCKVTKEGYPDTTAFDKADPHYDPSSKKESPTWFMVNIKLLKKFKQPVTVTDMKNEPGLKDFRLFQRGNRLSVFPVPAAEAEIILRLADR